MCRACDIHDETINACRVLVWKCEGNRQLLWSGHRREDIDRLHWLRIWASGGLLWKLQ
jgi:hypothetical protein